MSLEVNAYQETADDRRLTAHGKSAHPFSRWGRRRTMHGLRHINPTRRNFNVGGEY